MNLEGLGGITESHSGRSLDAAELSQAVEEQKRANAKLGITRDSVVALALGNSIEFFVHLLALWAEKACVVPLDPAIPAKERNYILENCRATHAHGCQLSNTDPTPSKDADRSLILYTSGSTGKPKGVAHSFTTISARLEALRSHIPLDDLERTLCLLPTHFGHGLIGNSLFPLLHGKHLVIGPVFDADLAGQLGALIDTHEITFFSSVPAIWKVALPLSPPPLKHTLRRVHCASAPLTPDFMKSIRQWAGEHARVKNVYGITELGSWISAADDSDLEPGSLGQGWGAEFKIVNEDGQAAPVNQVGTIWVRSKSLMKGYVDDVQATKEVCDGDWFDTGDAGFLDPSGRLYLSGRLKTVINRAGIKVYPEEVDRVLSEHPLIADACSFGIPDELGGEAVAAAVVLHSKVAMETLEKWCLANFSRYKVPTRWFVLDRIPRDERGKLKRAQVRELCLSRG